MEEIISVLVCLGVLAFVASFITGAVLTLLSGDNLYAWDDMNEYCEDCGQDKDSVRLRHGDYFLCDACEDVAEVERAVRA